MLRLPTTSASLVGSISRLMPWAHVLARSLITIGSKAWDTDRSESMFLLEVARRGEQFVVGLVESLSAAHPVGLFEDAKEFP